MPPMRACPPCEHALRALGPCLPACLPSRGRLAPSPHAANVGAQPPQAWNLPAPSTYSSCQPLRRNVYDSRRSYPGLCELWRPERHRRAPCGRPPVTARRKLISTPCLSRRGGHHCRRPGRWRRGNGRGSISGREGGRGREGECEKSGRANASPPPYRTSSREETRSANLLSCFPAWSDRPHVGGRRGGKYFLVYLMLTYLLRVDTQGTRAQKSNQQDGVHGRTARTTHTRSHPSIHPDGSVRAPPLLSRIRFSTSSPLSWTMEVCIHMYLPTSQVGKAPERHAWR